MIVVDASVFNKLYLDEHDSNQARDLFTAVLERGIEVTAPQLLTYEVLATALHYGVTFKVVLDILGALRAAGMRLVEPDLAVLERAQTMASSGIKRSDCPQLQDCIYHALAIETGGVFLTADEKHFNKTKHYGNIALLRDYRI